MIATWRQGIASFGVAAFSFAAPVAACAQSTAVDPALSTFVQVQSPQSGSLAGRITNLHSVALPGVTVVLRNQSTGTETRTTTARNGAFRFASLEPGEYTLDAEAANLGHGRLQDILVSGGAEARVQAAMNFEPLAPAVLEAAAPAQIAIPPATAPQTVLNSTAQPSPATAIAANVATATLPLVPRPPLSTATPQLVASIGEQPIRPFPLTASRAPNTNLAPVAPIATTPVPAAISLPASTISHRIPIPAPSIAALPRTFLQTQSAPMQLALSAPPPTLFPLKAAAPPVLAADAAQSADPVATAVASTITAAQLQTLPASGRRWQEFLVDTTAASTTDSAQPSYRGSQQSAEVTVDGASISLAFGNTGRGISSSARADADPQNSATHSGGPAWGAGRGLGVSEAAIHEVTTVAGNVEAEGMRSAGGRTSVSTESGSNALHGQGFFFDRQNTWGARNPYTQWVQNVGSASAPNFAASPYTPPDHEAVWGLGVGGDIRRNRLFWFAALDSNHRNDPGVSTVKHPDEFFAQPPDAQICLLSAQLGLTSPGQQMLNCPTSAMAAGQAAYSSALEDLAGLLGPAPRASTQWLGFGRLDWQAAERHRFTLEGTGADMSSPGGGLTRVSEVYGSHSYGFSYAMRQSLMARWEAYLTPNLLAITQGSAGRAVLNTRPGTPSTYEQSFLSGDTWGQLPQIVVDARYGFTIGNPSRFGQGSYPDERLYHAQEMLDWVRGKLLVSAGFELDHNADAVTELRNQTGTYSYSTVASFISDALGFQKFGLSDALDPVRPRNCGVSNTSFGSQPCYAWYSQTMGPTDWHLSTNDWAGFARAQWQLSKMAVFSIGLRWEREQMPPPMAALANPELTSATQTNPQPPLAASLPSLGNNWGPRISFAIGNDHDRWPVLRIGYGIYYGRTENATIETALTQTGSLKGDLNFFMRPSDDCAHCAGGAPPFPYVFSGQPTSFVAPGAVGFAPGFHPSEVHQALAAVEQRLPGHIQLTAGAMFSLGRRLPISIDTNFAPAVNPGTITYAVKDPSGTGPIKATQITVPLYASWPFPDCPAGMSLNPASQCGRLFGDYQQITQITSRANSTYEAAMIKLARYGRGLSLHANYTYAHAMDWNPNDTTLVAGSDVLDPANFREEYGTSNLDMRHSASLIAIAQTPWKLHGIAGRFGNGWALSGIGQFHSGLPYTMHTSGSLAEKFDISDRAITGLGPGMNGSGGDNRVYGQGNDGRFYNIGRNTFRYPRTWKADLRLAKRFDLGEMRQLELMAETFNLFNHRNVTALETTGYSIENSGSSSALPTLCYLTINTAGSASCGTTPLPGAALPIAAFGKPLDVNAIDFYRERQIEVGLRMRF